MLKNIDPFYLAKVFIAIAMLSFGVYQIIITKDDSFIATKASLLKAYSKTYTSYSQERHQTKTRYYFQYRYIFNGKHYTSERYTHVNPGLALGVNRFKDAKEGTKFLIYINPNKPSYSVVQKGQPLFIYALALTGFFGVLNCLIELWFDKLHTSNSANNKCQIEKVRRYLMKTGAMTAIGIFVTLFMFIFAI